ncbi:pentatricopeptide repeat-containing protein [Tanacetum coccineum]
MSCKFDTRSRISTWSVTKAELQTGSSTLSSMIYLYGKQNQLERANQVFKAVSDTSSERKHLCHDVGATEINMLVNALTSCGKHREARNVINDCFCKNIEVDTVAYNTFIKAILDAGRLNFAASIYDRMLTNGVAPSIQTFKTMITVHGRRGDLDKAIDMFNTARIKGVALDEKAYTNMICYYGKAVLGFNKLGNQLATSTQRNGSSFSI